MIPREKVYEDREIVVVDNSITSHDCTKSFLFAAISEMRDGEELVKIYRHHGHFDAPFANDPGETMWVDQVRMVVRSGRPETDDEYFARVTKIENEKSALTEKDKIEYLRLKAKFENI